MSGRQTDDGLLPGSGLPASWREQSVWRILDTCFDPARLLAIWQNWRDDPARPKVLHVVAITAHPPSGQALRCVVRSNQERVLVEELLPFWTGLLPGMHRFLLAQGQFQLTLCVGELQSQLREQQFEADTVFFDSTASWDRWQLKALCRCCRRGTRLCASALSQADSSLLLQSGFALQANRIHYAPHWSLKTTRAKLRTTAHAPSSCVVVGAGLAGASVAAALARRGWQVEVIDSQVKEASGASGLPAGLLVPHVSVDDSPRSRLSRAGLRLMLQEARRLLQDGYDWSAQGVLEQRLDGSHGLPQSWTEEGQELSRRETISEPGAWLRGIGQTPLLWHAQAAWIKPARMVQAWLSQPGVTFRGNTEVARLERHGSLWHLRDAQHQIVASASHVILANAGDAMRLLTSLANAHPGLLQLPPVHGVRGVVSWGMQEGTDEVFPPFPVNGHGSLIPSVPLNGKLAWYAGATYEQTDAEPTPLTDHHAENLAKLRTLLPAVAQYLAPQFEQAEVQAWSGIRWVSTDRLPLVGPIDEGAQPSLWISAAMGSRGLTFAMLCAELLAARLGAEPWPLEASLAKFIHARRHAEKLAG